MARALRLDERRPWWPGRATAWRQHTFVEAPAVHRRAHGLPATSLAWGLWGAGRTGDDRPPGQAELARLSSHGVELLAFARPLASLTWRCVTRSPACAGEPGHRLLQRSAERSGHVPPLFRGLLKAPRRA